MPHRMPGVVADPVAHFGHAVLGCRHEGRGPGYELAGTEEQPVHSTMDRHPRAAASLSHSTSPAASEHARRHRGDGRAVARHADPRRVGARRRNGTDSRVGLFGPQPRPLTRAAFGARDREKAPERQGEWGALHPTPAQGNRLLRSWARRAGGRPADRKHPPGRSWAAERRLPDRHRTFLGRRWISRGRHGIARSRVRNLLGRLRIWPRRLGARRARLRRPSVARALARRVGRSARRRGGDECHANNEKQVGFHVG